jgi:hypothetical protein
MTAPRPLRPEYLPVYAAHVRAFGKLTLSEENALEVFRMAERYVAYRRLLQQMAAGQTNADLSLQARNALREDRPIRIARKRLVGIEVKQPGGVGA